MKPILICEPIKFIFRMINYIFNFLQLLYYVCVHDLNRFGLVRSSLYIMNALLLILQLFSSKSFYFLKIVPSSLSNTFNLKICALISCSRCVRRRRRHSWCFSFVIHENCNTVFFYFSFFFLSFITELKFLNIISCFDF